MYPVLWAYGPLRIYGYGAAITLGGIIGARLLWLRREKMGLKTEEDFWGLLNAACLSGFFGGKILFLIQYGWNGGLSIMNGYSAFGGFVSVPLAVWGFARWRKIPFLKLADYMFLCALFWHAFGRLGCFLAGCCYGRPTSLPWAVVFRDTHSMIPPELIGVPIHPVQLYESLSDLIISVLLYRVLLKTERGEVKPGLVAAGHFAAYGTMRFLLEFLRADDLPAFGPLTQGQLLGVALVAASGGILFWRAKCTPSS